MNAKSVLITLAAINLLCLPALAGLPNPKKMIYVGLEQPETTRETRNYVDPASIQKRGKLVFYTTWAFWKYLQGSNYASKEMHSANCQDWKDTRISFAGVNAQGSVTGEWSDGQTQLAVPGSLEDKALQLVCNR